MRNKRKKRRNKNWKDIGFFFLLSYILSGQKPQLNQQHPCHHDPSVPPDQKPETLQDEQRQNGQRDKHGLAETDPNIGVYHLVFGESPAQPKQKKRGNPRYEKK